MRKSRDVNRAGLLRYWRGKLVVRWPERLTTRRREARATVEARECESDCVLFFNIN